jgi:hypothetical protein
MSQQEVNKEENHSIQSPYERMRLIMSWVIVTILTGFAVYLMLKLSSVHQTEGDFWQTLIKEQFPVIIGLPMAGLGALFVTLVLRISTGPLEFEISGLKFKGGAAPIVFWLLCFLSISTAIGFLWQS